MAKQCRPCEAVLKGFGGNRNPPTLFAILAFKMARSSSNTMKQIVVTVKTGKRLLIERI